MDLLALGEHLTSLDEATAARRFTEATADERELMGQALDAVAARKDSVSWLTDPTGWIDRYVDFSGVAEDATLAGYQRDALDELVVAGRLAVRSVHGAGKTTLAALTILWFAITRDAAGIDWKIPTTATVYRQLLHYLWPEIHQWSARLRWNELGRPAFTRLELQVTRLKLARGQAWAMASNDAVAIEGAHAQHLLYVFDEAKGIPVAIWDAAEGAFSGAGSDTGAAAWALAISTPGEPSGRFYEISSKSRAYVHWATRHVTLTDAIDAGRVSAEWAQTMSVMWPPGSAVYKNRVLGEFASSETDSVIPLAWVEAAIERWYERGVVLDPITDVGVDVAREGDDETVIASIRGNYVDGIYRPGPGDGPFTAAAVLPLTLTPPKPTVVVDADGIGVGVYDELVRQPSMTEHLYGFHAAGKAEVGGRKWHDRSGQLDFANARAAMWWHLRDLLNPQWEATIALPPDDLLTGDLTAPKWRLTSGGAVLVESKADIKKRIGRSTDTADAVVMGLWGAILRAAHGPTVVTNPARARIPVANSSATGAIRSPFGAGR